MDVTRLDQRAYIKIAVLRGRNARECHSELVEAVGAMPTSRKFCIVSPSQYGYFDIVTLF